MLIFNSMIYPFLLVKVMNYKKILTGNKINSSYSTISVSIINMLAFGIVASMIANVMQIVPSIYFQISFETYKEFRAYIDTNDKPFFNACIFSYLTEIVNDVIQFTQIFEWMIIINIIFIPQIILFIILLSHKKDTRLCFKAIFMKPPASHN